ncbi:MAG: Gfo/Idh/MocA family oxidoreductase [Pirellulales bacterium]|nr:Gfo/Idh/MocA family oxidoreductase [Pirellulales bacterium]
MKKQIQSITRRQFVKQSTVAAVGLPLVIQSGVLGANEEIRVAIVGCGIRCATHAYQFGSQKGVRIAYLCDPDRLRLQGMGRSVREKFGYAPEEMADVRKLMERKDFDVLAVATMQYWHALPTIWACQTGRDVYCEKPLSHFIWEGRQMVRAARKYDRLVEVGTQGRSRQTDRQAVEYLRGRPLGKIRYVVAFANKARTSIGKRTTPLPIPETLDYDLWCGPARQEPIYRDKLQYDCSFTWNMGDGESCNQGTHEIDVARWVLGETGLPRRVMSLGGRFLFDDAGEVPNTQLICYEFPSAPVYYELHNLRADPHTQAMTLYRGHSTDTCVQCEGGYVMMHAGQVFDNDGKEIKRFRGGEDHFENFIRAVRSRRREDLRAEVLEGHLSTRVCHVGNVSYRLGRKASPAEIRGQAGDRPEFQDLLDRYFAHLKAHAIDPQESILGPWLETDPENECFKDDPEANKLVKGFYREPFTVPEI